MNCVCVCVWGGGGGGGVEKLGGFISKMQLNGGGVGEGHCSCRVWHAWCGIVTDIVTVIYYVIIYCYVTPV